MRILYAGASADLATIEVMLGREGFNVYSTDSSEEAIELGRLYDYDLCLLGDIHQAQRVIHTLRLARCKMPLLRFSRDASPESIISSLNAGADDYLIHSEDFHPKELVARIHAIVRRSKGHAASVIKCGDLVVNLDTKTASVKDKRVNLTGKEYAMIEVLALRHGSLVTKEMFLNHLYGGMDEPEMKIIDVFICKLRRKLPVGTIETVWGRGYLLAGATQMSSGETAQDIDVGWGYGGVNVPQVAHETTLLIHSPSIVPSGE